MISGSASYFVEKSSYSMVPGDIILVNCGENHRMVVHPFTSFESIKINFRKSITNTVPQPTFDIIHCFKDKSARGCSKISLKRDDLLKLINICSKIEHTADSRLVACEVLELAYFLELMVYINRYYMDISSSESVGFIPRNLQNILTYIDNNLQGDLSLKSLEEKFYINRYYLSHLFKKVMCFNINEYIIRKRLQNAKALLSNGVNPADACRASGFNDYSNFLRLFKKIESVSPSQFRKNTLKPVEPVNRKNSGDNDSTIISLVKLPDLVIADIVCTPPKPSSGDLIKFSAVILNIGKAATPPGVTIGVSFTLTGMNNEELFVTWSDTYNKQLLPGQSVKLTANSGHTGTGAWTAKEGVFSVLANVDDLGRIAESNKDNNKMDKIIKVRKRS